MLARGEGKKVTNVSAPVSKLLKTASIIVPTSLCENECHLEPTHRGYWIGRQIYKTEDSKSSLYKINDVPSVLKQHSPGGLGIIGASRPRTLYYDILQYSGISTISPLKIHNHLSSKTADGVPIEFFWHEVANDFSPPGAFGHIPAAPLVMVKDYEIWLTRTGICEKGRHSTLIFCAGSGIISRALPPNDLSAGVNYVRKELEWLRNRCHPHTKIIVASEMALFDEFFSAEDNSFRSNRNFAFNLLMQQLASQLNMTWLDVYSPSLSAGRSDWAKDHVHYYHKNKEYIGDAVSNFAALQYVAAAASRSDMNS